MTTGTSKAGGNHAPAIAVTAPHEERGKEGCEREQRERPEPAVRDRIAGHRIGAVGNRGDDRGGVARAHRAREPEGAPGAEAEEAHDDERARETHRAEEHRAEPTHQHQGGGRCARRAHARIAPRGAERFSQTTHTRPGDEGPEVGNALGEEAARPDEQQQCEHREHDRRRLTKRVGHAHGCVSGPLADRLQALLRVMLREERAEAGVRSDLELAQLRVTDAPQGLCATARRAEPPHVQQVPPPRAERGERECPTSGGQEDEHFEKRQNDPEGHHPEQRCERITREHHPHPLARDVARVGKVGGFTFGRGLAVYAARIGNDHHPCAGEPRAPAEIEIFGTGERRGVEAAELAEQVGAHEHRRARDVEDVADAVVLLLVELARLDAGVRPSEPVDRPSDLEQHVGVVGGHELGPDDACVRPERLFDEQAHGGRIEREVVVTDQEEARPRDRGQRLVRRAAEAGVRIDRPHEGPGQGRGDAGGGVDARVGVDDEHREVGVVLGPEGGERALEERAGVPGDDDGHDGRRLETGGSRRALCASARFRDLSGARPVVWFGRLHRVRGAYLAASS